MERRLDRHSLSIIFSYCDRKEFEEVLRGRWYCPICTGSVMCKHCKNREDIINDSGVEAFEAYKKVIDWKDDIPHFDLFKQCFIGHYYNIHDVVRRYIAEFDGQVDYDEAVVIIEDIHTSHNGYYFNTYI